MLDLEQRPSTNIVTHNNYNTLWYKIYDIKYKMYIKFTAREAEVEKSQLTLGTSSQEQSH